MVDQGPYKRPSDPLGVSRWQLLCHQVRSLAARSRSGWRILAMVIGAGILCLGIFALLYLEELGIFETNHNQLQTILTWQPSDNTLIFDRDEQKIGELFSNYHIFVPYEDLPADLIRSLIAIEDRGFWQHPGIDPKGMLRAAYVHLRGHSSRGYRQGASTLTQQLVRHFLLAREKTLDRKIKEIALALKLESTASKKRILELYANALFLGYGSYGVGAAAQRYFAKPLAALQLHELALISGLFQSPSRYNPHRFPKLAKKRQLKVLKAMLACGFLTHANYKMWARKPLHYAPYNPLHGSIAPYFVDYVDEAARTLLKVPSLKNQGYRIHTTLHPQLQLQAEAAVANAGPLLNAAQSHTHKIKQATGGSVKPRVEAALLATDPRSGEILAMVGGRNYEHSQFNRTANAHRQPGSAFKPIVYSLALLEGFRWSDIIYVSPITVAGTYRPHTPSSDFLKETTLLRAFYRSMNTPTVELGEKLGLPKVVAYARRLGMTSDLKMEFGTMLGASEATMLEMARVNGVFAHQGQLVQQIAITKITDRAGNTLYKAPQAKERSEQAIPPQLAYLTAQGMRQVLMRGTGAKAGSLAKWAAGKTGTSNDSKDNWFTGFASNLVTIVWVGTDESVPIGGNALGGTLALPIWQDFMTSALPLRPPREFERPTKVVSAKIHPLYGYPSAEGVSMWFFDHARPPAAPSGATSEATIENLDRFRDPFAK